MGDEETVVQDAPWLVLQKKIFGRYVQQKLRQAGIKRDIKDIIEDAKSSVCLIELAEVLSGQSFGSKKPKETTMRIKQINNASDALAFMKKIGIKSKASPEDIVDGNAKFVLGLIFAVISKYMKFDEEDSDSADVREALVLWLKNKTGGYENISIDNLTKSFHDGMIFCALIHKMRPKLIPYSTLDPKNKADNLALALDVAEQYCNVEKYIEPSDIANLDEIGMIVYLYDWYYGISLLQKQDVAARRIGKLVDMTILHDQMRADYIGGAESLLEWIKAKISELNKREIDNSMNGIRSKLEKFYDYKSKEKGDKIVEQLDLGALFDNLELRLKHNNRPPFQPPNDPAALEAQFVALDQAEAECSLFLHTELERQIRLDKLAKRMRAESEDLTKWVDDKLTNVKERPNIDSVDMATYHVDTHAVVVQEIEATKSTRMQSIGKIVDDLASEKYEFLADIQGTLNGLNSSFSGLEQAASQKTKDLAAEHQNQKDINDKTCKEFSEIAKKFGDYLAKNKTAVGNKQAALDDLLRHVQSLVDDSSEGDGILGELEVASSKVLDRQITINPYTNITLQDCKAQWYQFKLMLNKKKALLEAEIENSKRSGLSEEQVKEVNDNFDYFDKDRSGFLDRRELRSCLQSLGEDATPVDVTNILKIYDKDGDNKISKEEFTQYMMKKLGDSNTEPEIREGFEYLSLEKPQISEKMLEAVVNDLTFKQHHVEYLKHEISSTSDGLEWGPWVTAVFER